MQNITELLAVAILIMIIVFGNESGEIDLL